MADDKAKPQDKPQDKPKDKPKASLSGNSKKIPWVWLAIAFLSYAFTGWVAIRLAPSSQFLNLANLIARKQGGSAYLVPSLQFYTITAVMAVVLPILTALSEFSLVAVAYIIGGAMVLAALVFLAKLEQPAIASATIIWLGIVAVPIAGGKLSKAPFSKLATIVILIVTCLLGMGLGWLINQIFH